MHNLFIGLNGDNFCKTFCLPDGYKLNLPQLNDIKYNLSPDYTSDLVANLAIKKFSGRSLEGADYVAGVVGLNNLKRTEFANCII